MFGSALRGTNNATTALTTKPLHQKNFQHIGIDENLPSLTTMGTYPIPGRCRSPRDLSMNPGSRAGLGRVGWVATMVGRREAGTQLLQALPGKRGFPAEFQEGAQGRAAMPDFSSRPSLRSTVNTALADPGAFSEHRVCRCVSQAYEKNHAVTKTRCGRIACPLPMPLPARNAPIPQAA